MKCFLPLKVAIIVVLILGPRVLKAQKKQQPNIVFLLVDDMGYADVGCYGSSFYETPNIDALAREGMKFMNTYTAGSVCSPTRSSIMTGRYTVRTGVTDWIPGQKVSNTRLIQPRTKLFLGSNEVTFAELLKNTGYSTFYAGKWHLGDKPGLDPLSRGFEEYYSAIDMRRMKSPVVTDSLTKHTSDFIARKAKQNKPFIAFLSYYDVHTPIYEYPDLINHYKNKLQALTGAAEDRVITEHSGVTRAVQNDPQYASMVGAVDKSVGSIQQLLKTLGIEKNTIVVFTSDNGGLATSKKAGPTSNTPYRSGKGWLYEGGIRVPLIVKYPHEVKASGVCKEPTMSTDFYPTILQWAGLPPRPELHKDGMSLVPLLKQSGTLNRTDFYWHYPHYHGSTWTPGAAIRSGDWKLIVFYETEKYELYNLKEDPSEKQDLAAQKPEIVKQLKDKLEKWQKDCGAQLPVVNKEYDPTIKTGPGRNSDGES